MIYDKKSISCIQNFTVTQHSDMCVNAANTVDPAASHLWLPKYHSFSGLQAAGSCYLSDLKPPRPFLDLE